MNHPWQPGRGREKSNRAAMKSWGATVRLMMLRVVSGATVLVVFGFISERIAVTFSR